ncbi:hypothetical protein V6N11_058351 [Hibiscus sabdariffa]|uniref:CCHC-type domain-containing protein n=1 Tax=Hibiscus sabdariffa TaxID=183260 RepID=A0ABR2U4K8_9ROSI
MALDDEPKVTSSSSTCDLTYDELLDEYKELQEGEHCYKAKASSANSWYLDSGCSRHMIGDKSRFLELKSKSGGVVTFGDNSKGHIEGIGSIGNNSSILIDDFSSWSLVRRHALESRAHLCTERTWVLGFEPNIGDSRRGDYYGQLVTVGGIMTCTSVLWIIGDSRVDHDSPHESSTRDDSVGIEQNLPQTNQEEQAEPLRAALVAPNAQNMQNIQLDYLLSMKEMFEQLNTSLKKDRPATPSNTTPSRAPIDKILTKQLPCLDENKLECSIALLVDKALSWWETTTLTAPAEKVTWEFFVEEFKKKYVSEQYLEELRKKFLYLKQALGIEDFQELVNRAIATEAKMITPEKKKGDSHRSEKSTRSDSRSWRQSKRQRQQRENYLNHTSGLRSNFVPRPQASSKTIAPGVSTFSTWNTGQAPSCGIYKKNHYGQCKSQTNACYLCGEADHYIKDCPRNPNKVPARTLTNESRAPGRAYHIKGRDDEESPDVIAGTIKVNSSPAYSLIDSGSTLSFVCSSKLSELRLEPEYATTSLLVSNPLGKTIPIKSVCNQSPITIRGISFPINLYVIPSCEFDIILRLDWLEKHEAWIDCQNRRLYLRGLGKESILLIDKKPTSIFALMTMQDEYDFGLPNIPVIYEYVDVFPEELSGLPPTREVEFRIEIQPGVRPVSITPYRMALVELKELQKQLHEL